jgi:dienelactone hydrolase
MIDPMTEILLFHSELGLTEGARGIAARLGAAGHTVHTPDLFEGRTFCGLGEGRAFAADLGEATLLDRAHRAFDDHDTATAFIGLGLGAVPAYNLAQTQPTARACITVSAALPVDRFAPGWPAGVALDLHLKSEDPWAQDEDLPVARALGGVTAELYEYTGPEHLFIEDGHPDYDESSTNLMAARMLETLERIDRPVA